jgi:hypothetical protein
MKILCEPTFRRNVSPTSDWWFSLQPPAHAGSSFTDFLSWRWRRYVPPKWRFTQDLHCVTSQKTAFFIHTYCRIYFYVCMYISFICNTDSPLLVFISSHYFRIHSQGSFLPLKYKIHFLSLSHFRLLTLKQMLHNFRCDWKCKCTVKISSI